MPMRVPSTKAERSRAEEKRKRRGYVRKGEMLDREDGRFMPFARSLSNKLAGAGIKGDINDPNYLTFVEAVSKALASTSGKGRNLLDVALAVAKTHAPPKPQGGAAPVDSSRLRSAPPAPAMPRPAPVDDSPFPPVPGWSPGAPLPARPPKRRAAPRDGFPKSDPWAAGPVDMTTRTRSREEQDRKAHGAGGYLSGETRTRSPEEAKRMARGPGGYLVDPSVEVLGEALARASGKLPDPGLEALGAALVAEKRRRRRREAPPGGFEKSDPWATGPR